MNIRKSIKKIFGIACMFCLLSFSYKQDIQLSDTSGKQIPVLGWAGIPGEYTTTERYKEMADAGFTINLPWDLCYNQTYIAGDPAKYFTALDAAQTTGMKVFVGAGVLDHFSRENIVKLKTHPALAGYVLEDEPTDDRFPRLEEWVKKVQAIDSEHPCHISLGGNYGYDPAQLPALVNTNDTASFNTSCRKFLRQVPVPFLSYDHYPIVQDRVDKLWKEWDFKTEINPNKRKIRPTFYQNLESASSLARKSGIPLWAFALATWHIGDKEYPIPTINDLRLQVYSNLAYGVQCIQYFSYWYLNFGKEAPIEKDGDKTQAYYTIQAMNKEIKALSPVFLNAKMVWVMHTGEIPMACTRLDKTKLPNVFKSLDIAGGKGAYVSLMEKGKDNFLIVGNHDINEDITVRVKGTKALYRVLKDGSVVTLDDVKQTLTPGDIVIYFWKKYEKK